MNDFKQVVIEIIKSIPKGKVLSYGAVAKLSGYPQRARQVSYILHASSQKYNLPWHRVVNSKGKISLTGEKFEKQKNLLLKEAIAFSEDGSIDLEEFSAVSQKELMDVSNISG
jgi:methylated-DNA-protein-cysteine methyltransferase-like protein